MKENGRLSRRGVVRIVSYSIAVVGALTASAIVSYTSAVRYRTAIEYGYQRALNELTDYVNNLDITLDKGQYATTAKQMQGLSNKLLLDASSAKQALAQLPMSSEELSSTYKFLSQVGNFCMSLSERVGEGSKITEEELTTLDTLSGYAQTIAGKLQIMSSDMESGALRLGEVAAEMKAQGTEAKDTGVDSGFREIEESFTDYPSLLYDGPFSDHILQQQPKAVQGQAEVTAEEALQIAQTATGVTGLTRAEDTAGNLPCYNFSCGSLNACITKAGGFVYNFMESRTVGEGKLSNEAAIRIAQQALTARGISGCVYRYYNTNSGVLTVNFASTQDGVVCYPDLIKVGVALDDGSIVSYDAKGYVQNHVHRDIAKPEITEAQARAVVSSRLSIQNQALVIIPSGGLNEELCYEYSCTGRNGEKVLVYIHAQTGLEEKILVLIQDDTGILAM